MNILIAESNPALGNVWAGHLERQGAAIELCLTRDDALDALAKDRFDLIVLSQNLGNAEAISVADYAAYRHPDTKVIFVTGSTFFADGSIFEHCPNACACLPAHAEPQDLAALVEYHLRKVA